jgi:hypothetical protein
VLFSHLTRLPLGVGKRVTAALLARSERSDLLHWGEVQERLWTYMLEQLPDTLPEEAQYAVRFEFYRHCLPQAMHIQVRLRPSAVGRACIAWRRD